MREKTLSKEQFLAQYVFNPKLARHLGLELELWTVDPQTGVLIPAAIDVFQEIPCGSRFKPELPAHQIEYNSEPCETMLDLKKDLELAFAEIRGFEKRFKFKTVCQSLPPSEFELTVYPKPRYLQIIEQIPAERLRNAWIAATHIHYGLESFEHGIKLLNHFRDKIDLIGELSGVEPERMAIYKKMAGTIEPPIIEDTDHFYKIALEQGFLTDPRQCWWLVRINPIGTLEIRIFKATSDISELIGFAALVKAFISEAG
ncbi:hypothetical protein HQ571_02910 [Candidatus Kuenenbacteria bacterium]|nr:hypothetical protein [Candidatus Kuenenbacteria bacterium]